MVVIKEGLFILHLGRTIINHYVTVEKNFTVCSGVLIGQENRGARQGAPTIDDNVYVGQHSVIVGKVTIGYDVLIAPNTFINCNILSYSVVFGNPCVINHKDNTTNNYINNRIE